MFTIVKENLKLFILVAAVGFILGAILFGSGGSDHPSPEGHASHAAVATADTTFTCSMHPNIRQQGPGDCPICGMDLIPAVSEESGSSGPRQLKLSDGARKLAQVETATVERSPVFREVRMVGRIVVDETREGSISAWIGGRVDRMMVDYDGAFVRNGQPIVSLYSPALYTAQQELLQAAEAAQDRPSETTGRRLEAVRKKLKLLGLSAKQIQAVESGGEPQTHVTVTSPMSGIVLHRQVVTGDYVKQGQTLYQLADLSRVWVELHAYESDLPWIREGQAIQFQVKAHPGKTFTGSVVFVDPLLDPETRTVRVRVEADNRQGLLKPDMYVHGTVLARLDASGAVIPTDADAENPLVIPTTAPLITGRRAVVYVSVPDDDNLFAGREVVLGPRVSDGYVVLDGLLAGELVVVKGNFKIDSELQIRAEGSMMYPAGGAPVPHDHGEMATDRAMDHRDAADSSADTTHTRPLIPAGTVQESFEENLRAYFDLQVALSEDDLERSLQAADRLTVLLRDTPMAAMSTELHHVWMNAAPRLKEATGAVKNAANLGDARRSFEALSIAMLRLVRQVTYRGNLPVYQYHCPMAFDDKGADWLQDREGTANPYFGSAMYKCGVLEERIFDAGDGGTR